MDELSSLTLGKSKLVAGDEKGYIFLWDIKKNLDNTFIRKFRLYKREINNILFHKKDYGKIISCSGDGSIKLWMDDDSIEEIGSHKMEILAMHQSIDGRIASAS